MSARVSILVVSSFLCFHAFGWIIVTVWAVGSETQKRNSDLYFGLFCLAAFFIGVWSGILSAAGYGMFGSELGRNLFGVVIGGVTICVITLLSILQGSSSFYRHGLKKD